MKVQNQTTGEPVRAENYKRFADSDVREHGAIAGAGSLTADRTELIQAPTDWQRQGLQETASGYGRRLNTGLKIHFNGKAYRLYCTCFSNAGSVWFKTKGRTIYVS